MSKQHNSPLNRIACTARIHPVTHSLTEEPRLGSELVPDVSPGSESGIYLSTTIVTTQILLIVFLSRAFTDDTRLRAELVPYTRSDSGSDIYPGPWRGQPGAGKSRKIMKKW